MMPFRTFPTSCSVELSCVVFASEAAVLPPPAPPQPAAPAASSVAASARPQTFQPPVTPTVLLLDRHPIKTALHGTASNQTGDGHRQTDPASLTDP
jgi:hypothetical protein